MKRPTDLCANRRCRHPRSDHGMLYRGIRLATCRRCATHPYENSEGDMICACYRFEEP